MDIVFNVVICKLCNFIEIRASITLHSVKIYFIEEICLSILLLRNWLKVIEIPLFVIVASSWVIRRCATTSMQFNQFFHENSTIYWIIPDVIHFSFITISIVLCWLHFKKLQTVLFYGTEHEHFTVFLFNHVVNLSVHRVW